jgi:hypothetical protein
MPAPSQTTYKHTLSSCVSITFKSMQETTHGLSSTCLAFQKDILSLQNCGNEFGLRTGRSLHVWECFPQCTDDCPFDTQRLEGDVMSIGAGRMVSCKLYGIQAWWPPRESHRAKQKAHTCQTQDCSASILVAGCKLTPSITRGIPDHANS